MEQHDKNRLKVMGLTMMGCNQDRERLATLPFPIPYTRIGLCFLLLFFSILCFTAQAGLNASAPHNSPELVKVTLQLKWQHQFQFAGYYAAIEKGFYRDAGLDVKLVEAPENGEIVNEVIEKRAEFGVTGPDLILHRAKGRPVVALAAIFQHSPQVLLARKDSGINSIHDLKNKIIMLEQPSDELHAYLLAEKIPLSELNIISHKHTPQDFIDGKVDALSAYVCDETFLINQAGVEYLTFSPRASGVDFYGDLLFTTEQQIAENPELVKAFVEASIRGWDYALTQPDEIIELIWQKYSQRHSLQHLAFEAEQMQRHIFPDVVEVGYMNPGRWRHIADTYAALEMLPADFSLDGFLYDRFPQSDFQRFFRLAAFLLFLAIVVFFISARLYQQSKIIHQESIARLRAEERFDNLKNRYQVMIENAPFPILISSSTDGRIFYMNPGASQLFGIDQHTAVGTPASRLYVHPEERVEILAELNEKGLINNRELLVYGSGGTKIWTFFSASRISFENEPALFASFIDITESKKARIELDQANQILQLITRNMLDVVWLLDLKTNRFVYVSPSVYKLRGYTPEEIMNQPFEEALTQKSRDDVARWLAGLQAVAAPDQSGVEEELFRVYQPHKNGEIIPTEVSIQFVFDANGKPSQIVGVSRDITARIEAEQAKAILEARYQQAKKAESLNRMAGAIAHTFNNQLQAIMGNLEIVLEDTPPETPMAANAEAAAAATRQAAEISLLMLTCLGQSRQELSLIDLADLGQRIVTEFSLKMPESIKVDKTIEAGKVRIRGNAGQLKQAIVGLLTNAVEAIDNLEKGWLKVAVTTIENSQIPGDNRFPGDWEISHGRYAFFEVADNGHGISPADIERIFDPFFTTRFPGRGLGLAVILGIIRAHQGGLTVSSEPGVGSTFRFYLPLIEAED